MNRHEEVLALLECLETLTIQIGEANFELAELLDEREDRVAELLRLYDDGCSCSCTENCTCEHCIHEQSVLGSSRSDQGPDYSDASPIIEPAFGSARGAFSTGFTKRHGDIAMPTPDPTVARKRYVGMEVGDAPPTKTSIHKKYYDSSSDSMVRWLVTRWSDGTLDCTCPGFYYRETCKHVKDYDRATEARRILIDEKLRRQRRSTKENI